MPRSRPLNHTTRLSGLPLGATSQLYHPGHGTLPTATNTTYSLVFSILHTLALPPPTNNSSMQGFHFVSFQVCLF